jgi:hypothetical protein
MGMEIEMGIRRRMRGGCSRSWSYHLQGNRDGKVADMNSLITVESGQSGEKEKGQG